MKLDDIDILNSWRNAYNTLKIEVKVVSGCHPAMVTFSQTHIRDSEVLRAVRDVTLPILQRKLDEAKTKLMMLGITEFPE
jgi:hypothetical protein